MILLGSGPLLAQQVAEPTPEYLAADRWAGDQVTHWEKLWVPDESVRHKEFSVEWGMSLTDAWKIVWFEGTTVKLVETLPISPQTQLALLRLASPRAPIGDLLPLVHTTHAELRLGEVKRTSGNHGRGRTGPADAPPSPEIEAALTKISEAPIPFWPDLVRTPMNDGEAYTVIDGWRTPPFVFTTHGLTETPEGKAKWGQLEEGAEDLFRFLSARWESDLKASHFQPILGGIRDISIQGPAWFEVAVQEGWDELIERLLKAGLDPRKPGPDGLVPLVSACQIRNETLFQSIVARWGSPLKVPRPRNTTPLMKAVFSNLPPRVKQLVAWGARPSTMDSSWEINWAFEFALGQKNLEMVRTLLEVGFTPGEQQLRVAEQQGFKEAIPLLKAAMAPKAP